MLSQRVTDFTNTLSYAEWSSLEREIRTFEDTTSNQVLLLMVPSVDGLSIEEFATRTFEVNRPGQEGKDNGVLVVISLNDRLMRIEVGYGLEGVLTDAATRQIIEREMKPRFRDGQYYAGLIAAVYAIAGTVGGEYTVDERGREAPMIGLGLVITFFLFFLIFIRPLFASRRRSILSSAGIFTYSGWGWSGSGSHRGGSGGGFVGRSSGGFSGGGGLSGGGGATGSW